MLFSKCYYCPFIMCQFCHKYYAKNFSEHTNCFQDKSRYSDEQFEGEINLKCNAMCLYSM